MQKQLFFSYMIYMYVDCTLEIHINNIIKLFGSQIRIFKILYTICFQLVFFFFLIWIWNFRNHNEKSIPKSLRLKSAPIFGWMARTYIYICECCFYYWLHLFVPNINVTSFTLFKAIKCYLGKCRINFGSFKLYSTW